MNFASNITIKKMLAKPSSLQRNKFSQPNCKIKPIFYIWNHKTFNFRFGLHDQSDTHWRPLWVVATQILGAYVNEDPTVCLFMMACTNESLMYTKTAHANSLVVRLSYFVQQDKKKSLVAHSVVLALTVRATTRRFCTLVANIIWYPQPVYNHLTPPITLNILEMASGEMLVHLSSENSVLTPLVVVLVPVVVLLVLGQAIAQYIRQEVR